MPEGGSQPRDEFLDDILPTTPTHAEPPKRGFEPWHKPRKQYVRLEQWGKETKALVRSITLRDGRPVRYLGLPGSDMLDIRVLHDICSGRNARLKFIGFDKTLSLPLNQTELNISGHEISALPDIHGESIVLADAVEKVGNTSSVAYGRMSDYGPFDVVNLDLCDCVAGHPPASKDSYYDALEAIAAYQVEKRADPWLFFLTTRVCAERVHPDTMRRFGACISDNYTKSPKFRRDIERHLGLDADSLARVKGEIDNGKYPEDARCLKLFSAGFSKWLLGIMMSSWWQMEMLQGYCYQVNPSEPHPDMLSLAFKMSRAPHRPTDRRGIVRPRKKAHTAATEIQIATKMLPQVGGIVNLDKKLGSSKALARDMTDSSARLLQSAGYDPNAYRKWVRQGCPSQSR